MSTPRSWAIAPPQLPADALERWFTLLRRFALLLLLIAICGYLIDGANRPANPHLVKPSALAGFPSANLIVQPGPGLRAAPACVLVASTPDQQAQGWMGQTSMHGYAGMVFAFEEPSTAQFYMKDTPMPLSIAWFDAGGRFITALDMPPCRTTANCPTYGPGVSYRSAIEVPEGRLASIGIGPGSTVHLGGGCSV